MSVPDFTVMVSDEPLYTLTLYIPVAGAVKEPESVFVPLPVAVYTLLKAVWSLYPALTVDGTSVEKLKENVAYTSFSKVGYISG